MGKKIIKLKESDLERIVRRVMNEDDGSPMDRFLAKIDKMKENPNKGKYSGVHPHSQEVYKDDNWTIAKLNSLLSEEDLFNIKGALRHYGLGTGWVFIMYLYSNNDNRLKDYLKRVGPTYFIIPSNGDNSKKFLFNPEINYLADSRGNSVDVSNFEGGVAEFIEDKLNNQQDDMGDLAESKKRVVKLTESQLVNIIERVIKEEDGYNDLQMSSGFKGVDPNYYNPNRIKVDAEAYRKRYEEMFMPFKQKVDKMAKEIVDSDEAKRHIEHGIKSLSSDERINPKNFTDRLREKMGLGLTRKEKFKIITQYSYSAAAKLLRPYYDKVRSPDERKLFKEVEKLVDDMISVEIGEVVLPIDVK